MYLTAFSCSTGSLSAITPSPPKRNTLRSRCRPPPCWSRRDLFAQLAVGDVLQRNKVRRLNERLEGLVQPVLAAVVAQLAHQRRGRDLAGLDREQTASGLSSGSRSDPSQQCPGKAHRCVRNECPHRGGRTCIRASCGCAGISWMPSRCERPNTGQRLPLRVGVDGVRLDVGGVLQQAIDDVDRLPDTARNEVAEQRDVRIGHVVVGDAAVAAIRDVVRGEQILVVESYLVPSAAALLPSPQHLGSCRPRSC